jgi:putative flippase GtrA
MMSVLVSVVEPRKLKFTGVGAFCTLVQILLLYLLVEAGVWQKVANPLGFLISTQVNFVLSSLITWSDRIAPFLGGDIWPRLLKFNTMASTLLLANTAVYMTAILFCPYLVAGVVSLVGTAAGMMVSYTFGGRYIFPGYPVN